MRYVVEPVDLDKLHPVWPNQKVFKIRDLQENYLSKNCYTSEVVAKEIVKNKNLTA